MSFIPTICCLMHFLRFPPHRWLGMIITVSLLLAESSQSLYVFKHYYSNMPLLSDRIIFEFNRFWYGSIWVIWIAFILFSNRSSYSSSIDLSLGLADVNGKTPYSFIAEVTNSWCRFNTWTGYCTSKLILMKGKSQSTKMHWKMKTWRKSSGGLSIRRNYCWYRSSLTAELFIDTASNATALGVEYVCSVAANVDWTFSLVEFQMWSVIVLPALGAPCTWRRCKLPLLDSNPRG